MPTIPELKKVKRQAFQQADEAGDEITPQQWGHVIGVMQGAMDKVNTTESPETAAIMTQLEGMLVQNNPMSFQEMDSYREQLASIDEPAAQKLTGIIDDALETMGAVNPHLKEAIPASQGLRMREGLKKLLEAALSYKEQAGTDMMTAMKAAVDQYGVGNLPVESRKMVQNMLMTGDSSEFTAMLQNDVGGDPNSGIQQVVS
jgi:hypothetical protein